MFIRIDAHGLKIPNNRIVKRTSQIQAGMIPMRVLMIIVYLVNNLSKEIFN